MSRSLPEWIGKTDDTRPPPRVRLRVFEAYGGRCHISGRKIMPGEVWELEHVKALINGGENRESNLAPALKAAHRLKTNEDLDEKSWIARVRGKHTGAIRPKGHLSHPDLVRGVDGKVKPRKSRPTLKEEVCR